MKKPSFRQLTPPFIAPGSILQTLACIRPMRDGCFNISLETSKGNKTIVNCYGHGGSGWTTSFGSVEYAVALFKKQFPSTKGITIRIVGAGCMGLLAAIELARLGYTVSGITAKQLYDTPSWQAAGYFALVSIKTSPGQQTFVDELGVATFHTCQQIEQGKHPYLTRDSVRYLPVYCHQESESGLAGVQMRGLIPRARSVTIDFGKGISHADYLEYMSYFMDGTKLMQQFLHITEKLKIPIEMRTIHSFDDIDDRVIFNCSGLGSQTLSHDDLMIPVRGHLVILNPQAGTAHMDYMIYSHVQQEGQKEPIYLFPKSALVNAQHPEGVVCKGSLGGTFIPKVEHLPAEKLAELDRLEVKKLLDRNSLFFHGKPFSSDK